MSAVQISDAAAYDETPGETAPATAAAPPPPDDGTQLSNERPFPGLRPFGFADRGFFFGRERQAFALYRLVENGRFIAVIGGSGSGKSSLVLAGLQALLADETADSGGPTWAFLDMRPGGARITRLASALSKLSAKDSPDETARRRDRIEWTLRRSSLSFESALAEAGGLGGRSLILVVDQFEELFRFDLAGLGYRRGGVEEARRRDEATQFVQILLDADRRRIQNVRVLITMRSDFIGDCANFHGLSEAVSATQYLVPNLTRSQLEEAIRNPIGKAGGTIEPELVERLLNDCGDELDQLPVRQHCLMRLWDRADREKRWWDSRPRTPAWADRYRGGGFERVKTLVDEGIAARLRLKEAKQRSKRIRRFSAILVGVFFFASAFACVHLSGLLVQPRLLAKMVSAGGRSKQSSGSGLDRPLLRAVYLPLPIERSRPSLSVSCKVGASAFKQCPRAPISSGGCDSPAGTCVALAARHQLPGDPRHLVGERHRRELGRLTLQQRREPAGRVVRGAPARLPDHRGRALLAVECSRRPDLLSARGTTGRAHCPSGTAGSARQAGSSRASPGPCLTSPTPSLAAGNRSRLERR